MNVTAVNVTWHMVEHFPLAMNLLSLLSQLESRGMTCHVTEEKGQQQLWVGEKDRVIEAIQLSKQWVRQHNAEDQALDVRLKSQSDKRNRGELILIYLLRYSPVNIIIVLLGVIGAILIDIDAVGFSYAHLFLFQPLVDGVLQPFTATVESNQYWRLLTPVFLHFGIFHIMFNGAILWSMGTRIERAKGSFHYLSFVIVVGVLSNIAQHWSHPNTIFGGLSGVVYGVIGYIAIYQQLMPHPLLQFNRTLILVFILWLLAGFTGLVDLIIPGSVANMSHLAGLIVGAGIGFMVAVKDKYWRVRQK